MRPIPWAMMTSAPMTLVTRVLNAGSFVAGSGSAWAKAGCQRGMAKFVTDARIQRKQGPGVSFWRCAQRARFTQRGQFAEILHRRHPGLDPGSSFLGARQKSWTPARRPG